MRPPWRKSSREAVEDGQSRDNGPQPQLCRRSRFTAAKRSRAHAHGSERLDTGRHAPPQPATVQRPVPPRGLARPARFALFVQRFRENDGGVEGVNAHPIAKQLRTVREVDFGVFLSLDLRNIGDLQTAIPRIAKDQRLIRAIRESAERIPSRHVLVRDDARNMSRELTGTVQLVITSPPYWTLKKYRDTTGQLGHISDYDEFLLELDRVWEKCFHLLVPGGRLVCVVGDVCLSRRKTRAGILSYLFMQRFRNVAVALVLTILPRSY